MLTRKSVPQSSSSQVTMHQITRQLGLSTMLTRLSALLPQSSSSQVTMHRITRQLERIDAKVEAPRVKQYACLVDAENTQPAKLASVISELNGYGDVVVRRIYGDFSRPNLLPWKGISNELSFRPHAQFAVISGKGSSDMAMAMDAIDLLHDDGLSVEGFALVSSDSDFTPLASRLREKGKHVIGFGRRTTPTPFVNACHTFVHLENLGTDAFDQGSSAAPDRIDQGRDVAAPAAAPAPSSSNRGKRKAASSVASKSKPPKKKKEKASKGTDENAAPTTAHRGATTSSTRSTPTAQSTTTLPR